jgi:hypothetical protein
MGDGSRAHRRREARTLANALRCEHGTIAELEQQLQATGVDDSCCAAEALHQTPPCVEQPDVAVLFVTMLDDGPHVLVLPLCARHHDAGIEHAATHSIHDTSASFEWANRSGILRAIHGGPQPLCRGAAMTFAIVRR